MTEGKSPSQRSVSRFAWRIALLGIALVLIAWGAYVVEKRVRLREAREGWIAMLADMRRSGEPFELADLPRDESAGEDWWRWLEEFNPLVMGSGLAPDPGSGLVLVGPTRFRVAMGTSGATRVFPRPLPGVEQSSWQRFVDPDADWAALAADEDAVKELRALRDAEPAVTARLERIEGLASVDVGKWLERRTGDPIFAASSAARVLELEAFLADKDGDVPALERAVRRMMRVAALSEQSPELISAESHVLCLQSLLRVLDRTAASLSPQFIENEVETFLASLDVRAGVARDLNYEVLAFLTFPQIRAAFGGDLEAPVEAMSGSLDASDLPAWQAYVEGLREIAAEVRMPYATGRAALDATLARGSPSARGPFFSMATMGPPFAMSANLQVCATLYEQACELELGALFTRIRLAALRGGLERARAIVPTLTDPYDGMPLRTRLDPDGALRVWSAGPDGVDQTSTGAPASDDVELVLDGEQ